MMKTLVPLSVPRSKTKTYIMNYNRATKRSGNLMLFAGDQKIEHGNSDFYGKGIHNDDSDPEHLFRIAAHSNVGVFATQQGLIEKYGMNYPNIDYLIKTNSKTNLDKASDPYSEVLSDISDIIRFKRQTGLKIVGIGYTLYLGSHFEPYMMRTASKLIREAHQNGLITVLWIYPRGKTVKDEKHPETIAHATGVAACLGSDFVKVNYPYQKGKKQKDIFRQAILAAGRTKVICAGGSSVSKKEFLNMLNDQLSVGAAGNATGRNIHQKGLEEAIRFCNAIYALTVEKKSLEHAISML